MQLLDNSERTIATLGDGWRPLKAKPKGDKVGTMFYVMPGKKPTSARMFEVSLLGVGTGIRLERGAWPMVN